MKRVGKGFSGAVTLLFPTMMVQAQEEMGKEPIADEAANKENVPTQSNDPPLSRTAQAKEITSLKNRVKKLERKRKSKTPRMKRLFNIGRSAQVVSFEDEGLGDQEDASKQGRKIGNIDKDAERTKEKVVEEVSYTAKVSVFCQQLLLKRSLWAQALAELRSAKPKVCWYNIQCKEVQTTTAPSTIPKAKSITFSDPTESTTRTTLKPIPLNIKDNGKAKMIKPEKP
ncbi:hypothetical protein Tco_0880919 [Tanacetum coccineum]